MVQAVFYIEHVKTHMSQTVPDFVHGILTETAIFPKMSSGIVWPLSMTCL